MLQEGTEDGGDLSLGAQVIKKGFLEELILGLCLKD